MSGCFDNFFIGCIWLTDVEIFADSAVFDPGVLKHHAKAATQRMTGNFIDRVTINRDCTAGHIIESHQQVDKGCFSTASWSDDCDTLAWFCMQVEIFNQFFVRNVAETNVIDVDFTSDISDGVLGISTFRFFFQKSKDSGRACKCTLKLCDDRTDIIEWFHVLICISKKYGQTTNS